MPRKRVLVVVCVLIVVSGWNRLKVALGSAVPILGLAAYNWSTFGAPWRTGQGYWLGNFHLYSLSYVTRHPWPPGAEGYYASSLSWFGLVGHTQAGFISNVANLWFYPLILFGFSAIFGPPWLTAVGLGSAVWLRARRDAKFTLFLAASSVPLFMPNYGQDPRYLAAPCILLIVFGVAGITQLGRVAWQRLNAENKDASPPGRFHDQQPEPEPST